MIQMGNKLESVKSFFDQPRRYLSRSSCDVRVRTETVQKFVRWKQFDSVLDIGCGDGSVSRPLATTGTRITLVDISTAMLSLARSKYDEELEKNLELVNTDFMATQFTPASYDLIICLGVLAHVESPEETIAKMVTLLKPHGKIIIEFTDSRHFMKRISDKLRRIVRPSSSADYVLNPLSAPEVMTLVGKYKLKCESIYRYSWWAFPGTHRVIPQDLLYLMTRFMFGDVDQRRNSWLGNEYICLLSIR